jgi:hypothetical protein
MNTYLESRFGSRELKLQQKKDMQQVNKRAYTLNELEHLTNSLCAATQAGMCITVIGCLERQVEKYTKKVEVMDAIK